MRYKLMHRDSPTHVQKCERLALEFYCDAWAQVESRNLAFHRLASQQAKYHKASAKVIMNQLCADNAHQIGVPTILPASFPNSPRFYHNLYLDAVALPRRFGKPDLFITMTCNPHWDEIKRNIPAGSHWKHHPDIVARVFELKLQSLLDVLTKKKLFGEVLAYCVRIEWQARGMPHAHILIILMTKILSPRHIDEIVWAEVPCPEQFPELHKIVARCMIHNPCDDLEDAPCRKKSGDGTCFRKFPKAFASATDVTGQGWPQYRRRGRFVITRSDGRVIDDRWVVPYNPMLLMMFDCHINTEISAHKRCFKYIYKYCFKSPDKTTAHIDEIDAYVSGRFLTAGEAVWRFLGLRLHNEYPAVKRLDVHLPCHQQVIFDPTQDVRDIFEAAESSSSTLLEWFELNKRDGFAATLLYREVPEYYIWKDGTWIRRTYAGTAAVGRLYGVPISNYELFALRSLLNSVRGCTSFTDILMVDGFIHPTFREASAAAGFVHDDSEFIASFQEFVDTRVGPIQALRFQFAMMLLNTKTLNAVALFHHFAGYLCDDDEAQRSRCEALFDIERIMQRHNKSLVDSDYGFDLAGVLDIDIEVDERLPPADLPLLTDEQQLAMDYLNETSSNPSNTNNAMAIIAPAGTGKTAFVQFAVRHLQDQGRSVLCVAASALAATLLPNGRTAHSGMGIPLECDYWTYCRWDARMQNVMRAIDVIFWDEISMVSIDTLGCVDRSLKRLMSSDALFGGKVIVFLGDFRQLAPVVKGARGEHHSILHAVWFHLCRRFRFTRNFRSSDPTFQQLLTDVGDGTIDEIEVPSSSIVNSIDELILRVFGSNIADTSNDRKMILAFTLDQCSMINDAVISRFPSSPSFSVATDDLRECKNPDEYPEEYVSSLMIPGAPPYSLPLQTNARYMILRNAAPPGMCNGTQAVLLSFSRFMIKMRLLSGPGKSKIVHLPRFSFRVTSENSGLPFAFTRRQFPIIPSYCVSVHKSQGQSLDFIGLVAEKDAFSHGQVYVGMSRVGSWHQIAFFSPRGETFIKNKVAKELIANMK